MELIVISDLHLSGGYNEETGKYSRNEDFFFDDQIERFLKYLQPPDSSEKHPTTEKHLIIAGDMFDFLQVDGKQPAVTQSVQLYCFIDGKTLYHLKRASRQSAYSCVLFGLLIVVRLYGFTPPANSCR